MGLHTLGWNLSAIELSRHATDNNLVLKAFNSSDSTSYLEPAALDGGDVMRYDWITFPYTKRALCASTIFQLMQVQFFSRQSQHF